METVPQEGGGLTMAFTCTLPEKALVLGASVACDGVCLTVVEARSEGGVMRVRMDVSHETIACSTLSDLQVGDQLNLEAALCAGDALGGHIVSGHVDGRGVVRMMEKVEEDGTHWRLVVEVPDAVRGFVAVKGSVAIDGVSLTINAVEDRGQKTWIRMNIIPHTFEQTTLGSLKVGSAVNVEADMLARYAARQQEVLCQS